MTSLIFKTTVQVVIIITTSMILFEALVQAQTRPGLDDFYERTRSRTEGFNDCFGYCDGEYLLQALIGGQVANPGTNELKPARAEGFRFGADAGVLKGTRFLARTKAWGDILYVEESRERIDDYVSASTLFLNTTEPGGPGIHLSADSVFAARTELEAEDFREFRSRPYRIFDLELEAAPVGPKVEKEGFIALPIGYARRIRWDQDYEKMEQRETWSGAASLRAFQKRKLHHYQFDVLRVTRINWTFFDEAEGSDNSTEGSKFSFGYQRLSPDIDWLQIWLLFGWGRFSGLNETSGFLTRLGAEIDAGKYYDVGFRFDRDYSLDPDERTFSRVYHLRFYHHITPWQFLKTSLSYEYVTVEHAGSLHAIAPGISLRPLADTDFEIGIRYRLHIMQDKESEGVPENHRINGSADFLF